MMRLLVCALVSGLTLCALVAPDARAEKKKVLVTMSWSGSVDDEKLAKPEVINNAKTFEKIWKDYKIEGPAPKLDFTKFIVVGTYSVGSKLNLAGVTLDDESGNLEVLGFGTRDIRPGFRFVLAAVRGDDVKTVNGKKLPKE